MGHGTRRHNASIALALGSMIMLTVALLSPPGAATQGRATPSAEGDDALYQDALPWELADDVEKMVVYRVVDGDTVHLRYPGDDWYYPTRIIGIQAPELDGPYTDEQCYGDEAKAYLAELLPVGGDVYAQRDHSNRDRNGRLLRHLFVVDQATGDAYLVSELLVLGGYADARPYPPDDLYDDVLDDAETEARLKRAGALSSLRPCLSTT